MCAQFILKTKANEFSKRFGIKIPQQFVNWDIRPRGFIKTELAPVIVFKDGLLQVREMCFSLCPSWSKEFPYKWSSYNARMERKNAEKSNGVEFIYEVPTWRDSFNKGQTCLVPMSGAIESSYFGTHAGNMIKLKVKDDEIFYVAGLWSDWIDQKSGEIKETFTLLTDDPYEFFLRCGHDRSVFVIAEQVRDEYLKNNSFKPKERFEFLRKNRISLNWDVAIDRPLASGWAKKAPSEKEINEIKTWEQIS